MFDYRNIFSRHYISLYCLKLLHFSYNFAFIWYKKINFYSIFIKYFPQLLKKLFEQFIFFKCFIGKCSITLAIIKVRRQHDIKLMIERAFFNKTLN